MYRSKPDLDATEQELSALLGSPSQSCPPLDQLLAHGQQVLPPALEQSITLHLQHCQLCPMLLADLATLPPAELTPQQQERITASLPLASRGRSTKRFAAIAAGLIAAIGLALALHQHRTPASQATAPTTQPHPQVAALEIPLTRLAPPSEPPLLTRGGNADPNPSVAELLPAFNAYNAADYATAARRFRSLTATYPQSDIVWLYLGVSQLFLHQDTDAVASLGNARHHTNAADASWYAAIAAQRTHSPEAKPLLASLCALKSSAYSAESCRIVNTLP